MDQILKDIYAHALEIEKFGWFASHPCATGYQNAIASKMRASLAAARLQELLDNQNASR